VNDADTLPSGVQPGTSPRSRGWGAVGNGNLRLPVRMELRAATVGIASGYARVNLIPSRARASMFGVRALLP
jgi:hypothetical protein